MSIPYRIHYPFSTPLLLPSLHPPRISTSLTLQSPNLRSRFITLILPKVSRSYTKSSSPTFQLLLVLPLSSHFFLSSCASLLGTETKAGAVTALKLRNTCLSPCLADNLGSSAWRAAIKEAEKQERIVG